MSIFELKLPKLGESITEGTIMIWSVKVGDIIREDDILFEVTTAKVNAEVPSPVAGTIVEILFKEGETVPVGEIVARIQLESEEQNDPSDKISVSEMPVPEPAKTEITKTTTSENSSDKAGKAESEEEARWYSPLVLQLAQEAKIANYELDKIPGTGYLGRLTKTDINNYIEQKKKGLVTPNKVATTTPVTEKIQKSVLTPLTTSLPPLPTLMGENDSETIEMDPIRRIIADRMVQSKRISAHVTTVVEVDVTKLVNWRKNHKDDFLKHEGVSLTYLPAIVEAAVKALMEFPLVNASVDGYNIILKKHINMGIAVSLEDGNLIVPVIHDADKMSISGLALAIDSLANKARSNKLRLEEIQGGTFTITNFGTFKNIIGTPIINQPEVAILGVGHIEKKPAVIETPEGDAIAIRHKLYLSLTYDHRIINGSLGGAFVRRIADYLENWKD
jgi:2-oxoglutarate dehydrogenase E2 component (dihydrolipoamide succinyltransferase)